MPIWPFGSDDGSSTADGDRDRSYELWEKALDDPTSLSRREVREAIDMLDSRDPEVREDAGSVLQDVASGSVEDDGMCHPDTVVEAVPKLRDLCDDPVKTVRSTAAAALKTIANHEFEREGRPEAVLDAKPALFSLVTDRTEYELARQDAAEALKHLATAFPDEFTDDVDRLVELLDDDDKFVRHDVAQALTPVAAEHPDKVVAEIESVGDALTDNYELVADDAAAVLANVAEAYPEEVQPYAPDLVDLLQDHAHNAASALEAVGETDPEAVKPGVDDLVTVVLQPDFARDRAAAARALAPVARQYPGEFRGVTDRLADTLEPADDEDDSEGRVAVIRLLGAIGDQSVVETLREYTDDEDDAVAAAAEEVLADLDSGKQSVEFSDAPDPATVADAPDLTLSYEDIETDEHIGRGGNADVHRAAVEVDGTCHAIAVKEPMLEGTLDDAVVEEVVSEAEQWAALDDHDHVVDVVDWGTAPLPWIAMEYMDGGNLATKLVGFDESVWIGIRIADAVHYAHRQGVVHLDIKPANVLFRETEPGTWDVPKVADWGLAHSLIEHSKSVEGMTPQYAAPEQFDDDYGDPDQRTDVYQLGTVLYELFTGSPPFEGTPTSVMQSVLSEEPTPPSRHNKNLPLAVDEIVERAMATRKADRYETMVDLRRDLEDLAT